MFQCNHDHAGPQADKWTNIAAVGEMAASFISDAYWLATLFDVASGLSPVVLGLSFYGMGFGTAAALLSASGAAYSHRTLNTVHQPITGNDMEKGSIQEKAANETTPLHNSQVKLKVKQKIALLGDFISHAGDIAGPITFVANLATNNTLPRYGKALVQCGATLFGSIASIANVRSCKDAMLKSNELQQHSPGASAGL